MKANNKPLSRLLSLLLAAALLCGLVLPAGAASSTAQPPEGKIVVSQADYTLVDGVTETKFFLNNPEGTNQQAAFMVTVAPDAKATFKASYAGYYTSTDPEARKQNAQNLEWKLQRTTEQAAALERSTGANVIMGTNADYFNMQTGQPLGCLIMEGNLVQVNNGNANEPYFAVLKDGSFVIRDAGTPVDDVQEAISGPFYLVKDGVNQMPAGGEPLPVNSIGMKADGSVVTLMIDGRQAPYSAGISQHELADLLIAQGVVNALYLDGGGSATIATKPEGTDKLTVRNKPSDGIERTVSSALLLVSTAQPDGVFTHATLSPNAELYTPTRDQANPTTVQFSALGVDDAGGPAEVPADVTWALADPSCGTIDENGLFTAALDYTGEITALLQMDGKTVGTTSVSVVEPDELMFSSFSKSMDFAQTMSLQDDLGFNARINYSPINYKVGDFVIEVLNQADEPDSAIGTVSGNDFTSASASGTLNGKLRVSYTKLDGTMLTAVLALEIGKLPVVVFDYEPIDGKPQEGAHFHWGKNTYVNNGTNKDGGYILRNNESVTVPVHTHGSNNPEDWTYNTFSSPIVFSGNYDTAVPAAEIFQADGYQFYLWPNNSIDAYLAGNLSTTSVDDGGQVRFGDYSLELNFDYASYNGTSNSNYYLRNCGGRYLVEGQPSEVGVWVYADAETYNLNGYYISTDITYWDNGYNGYQSFSLVHDMVDENGNVYQSTNTDWVGWMYCYAKLDGSSYRDKNGKVTNWRDLRPFYSPEHPYVIINGQGMIWLSYQPAAGGGRYNGTLYFDNYRFVYGTNLDDLDNPIITEAAVNGTKLRSDEVMTIQGNGVEITSKYKDFAGKNASGIDASSTMFLVDGVEAKPDAGETEATYRMNLANGRHSLSVTVYDNFGNAKTENYYFDIQGDTETGYVKLSGADTVVMGTPYVLTLESVGTVKAADVSIIQLNTDFGAPVITPKDGWTITSEMADTGFKKAKLDLTAQWNGAGEAPADAEIATIAFNVPAGLDREIDFFTYQLVKAECTLPDDTISTCAQEKVTLELSAYYNITPGISIKGHPTVLTVTDIDGNIAEGVTVLVNDVEIGQTDANGQITAYISLTADSFLVRAVKDDHVSFTVKITVLSVVGDETGKPINVHETASKNGSTTQTVSWMANVDATDNKAVVEYAKTRDLAGAARAEGRSTPFGFATTKNVAYINSVQIDGLEPGTTYYYRAGDGNDAHWSEIRSFKTVPVSGDTRFFVLADTQMNGNPEADAESIDMLNQIGTRVAGYDFGIQTGDYVDSGANYAMWNEIQSVFGSAFAGIDMVHTMGNHEYSNDATGTSGTLVFHFDEDHQLCYSVRYGDIYIAVINNMRFGTISADELNQALAWIAEDSKDVKASWKILSTHQPAYYTNVTGGNERVHEILPPAMDELGFNVVFSGHDHSYARTEMLRDGKVVSEDGTVYFIGGDLGEKSRIANYAAVNNPDFHFASINQEDYQALYLDAYTQGETLTITARNYDGTPIDSVTLYSKCYNGHTFTLYEDGCAICDVCGKHIDVHDVNYTGWLTVKGTENTDAPKEMYFINGVYRTGWFQLGDDMLHFGTDGVKHETVTVDERTCTNPGRLVTTCQTCNKKYYSASRWAEGHQWDENHVCEICGLEGTDITTLPYTNVSAVYSYKSAGRKIQPKPVITDGDKTLDIRTTNASNDGYVTWQNFDRIGTATVTVEGRMDYYGTLVIPYRIVPDKVQNISVDNTAETTISLSWDPVLEAESYAVFRWDYGTKTMSELAVTDDTSITLENLDPNTNYTMCIKARKNVEGEDYDSCEYSWIYGKTLKPTPLDPSALQTAISNGESLNRNEYTTESLAQLDEALEIARQALAAATTQEALDQAAEALNNVLNSLVKLDLEALNEAIEEAEALIAEDYTEDSLAAVQEALEAARTLVEQGGSQAEVDAAAEALNAALEALEHVHSFDCPGKDFTDMPQEGNWAHAPIDWAVTNGITNGTSATTFSPEKICSRAEVVTFLWRTAGSPKPEQVDNPFTDVVEGTFYYNAVLWAVEHNITNGMTATTFNPAGQCTRGQIVTFLWRALGSPEAAGENPFADVQAGAYYAQPVLWAVEKEVTNGLNATTFGPNNLCNRAQVVTFLHRAYANRTPEPTAPTAPTVPAEPTAPAVSEPVITEPVAPTTAG